MTVHYSSNWFPSHITTPPLCIPSDIPDDEWYAHFESEFSFPDPHLQDQYDKYLDAFLASSPKTHYTVTTQAIEKATQKLKLKPSSGFDCVGAMHLMNGSPLLTQYLTLLIQMIFTQCAVPSTFCIDDPTPIPKKEKAVPQCTLFRPINVATSFCKLFELLFRDKL
jgi:hypothetical protein